MDLGRLTYNNLLNKGSWNEKSIAEGGNAVEKHVMALGTELMTKFTSMTQNGDQVSNSMSLRSDKPFEGDGTYLPWRFENPESKQTNEEVVSWNGSPKTVELILPIR